MTTSNEVNQSINQRGIFKQSNKNWYVLDTCTCEWKPLTIRLSGCIYGKLLVLVEGNAPQWSDVVHYGSLPPIISFLERYVSLHCECAICCVATVWKTLRWNVHRPRVLTGLPWAEKKSKKSQTSTERSYLRSSNSTCQYLMTASIYPFTPSPFSHSFSFSSCTPVFHSLPLYHSLSLSLSFPLTPLLYLPPRLPHPLTLLPSLYLSPCLLLSLPLTLSPSPSLSLPLTLSNFHTVSLTLLPPLYLSPRLPHPLICLPLLYLSPYLPHLLTLFPSFWSVTFSLSFPKVTG